MGRAATRGAQQHEEDGNAGRAVAREGSNVGKTAAWVGQQRVEGGTSAEKGLLFRLSRDVHSECT